jgi:hypothetical protein
MKKMYQKPTMTVVTLQVQSQLMQASKLEGPVSTQNFSREDYYEE